MRQVPVLGCAAALLLACALAHAADSTTLSVTATVLSKSNCKFDTTTPNTLAFGAIDPSSLTNASATRVWAFTCKGSAPTASFVVSAGNGLHYSGGTRQMQHGIAPTAFLPYSVGVSPANGNATKNVQVNLTITGTVLPADFGNAIAGAYSDTVTVSLTP